MSNHMSPQDIMYLKLNEIIDYINKERRYNSDPICRMPDLPYLMKKLEEKREVKYPENSRRATIDHSLGG